MRDMGRGTSYDLGMTATMGRERTFSDAMASAARLAEAVVAGEQLPELASSLALESGEVLHASVDAHAWRYAAVDVAYEQHRGFAVGGLLTFGVTAAASAAANRRARAEAERQAVPQWRVLGFVPVMATSHRLLVLHEGAWASVWYEAICQLRPALADDRLELFFEDDPPYLLQGPAVPYLAVVLATALAAQFGPDAVASALLPA